MKKKRKENTSIMESNGEIPKISTSKAAFKQIKYGSIATATTAVFIAVVVILNIVVNMAAKRIDLEKDFTQEQLFTLGDETIALLSEIKAAGSKAEITILGEEEAYRTGASSAKAVSAYTYIYKTTENYKNANGNISVNYIDPRYNPQYFKERGIELTKGAEGSSVIMVVYSPETRRYRLIYDNIFKDLKYVGLERRLTGSLLFVTLKNIQTIAIVSGHGEKEAPQFQSLMEDNGYEVKSIILSEVNEIPDYVQMLVVINPTREYSTDDIKKIDAFLSNNAKLGKHLMVFGDLDMYKNDSLESYISDSWGLSFGSKSVFDVSDNVYSLTSVYYPFLKLNYSEENISGSLSKNKFYPYVQLGKARAVHREYDSLDTVSTSPLISSFNTSFAKFTASTNISASGFSKIKKAEDDESGPFEIMSASKRVRYEGLTEYNSTVILSGSVSFMDDYFLANVDGFTQTTAEYMVNLTKHLVASSESYDTEIVPKSLIAGTLNFTNNYQVIFVMVLIVLVIPAIFAVIGTVVYRKRKYL